MAFFNDIPFRESPKRSFTHVPCTVDCYMFRESSRPIITQCSPSLSANTSTIVLYWKSFIHFPPCTNVFSRFAWRAPLPRRGLKRWLDPIAVVLLQLSALPLSSAKAIDTFPKRRGRTAADRPVSIRESHKVVLQLYKLKWSNNKSEEEFHSLESNCRTSVG